MTGSPVPVQDPATAPAGRRASWRIVLVHTVTLRQARRFVYGLLPVAVAVSRNVDPGPWSIAAIAVVITLGSLAFAVLGWWRFDYADTGSALVVTRGLLARSVRTVPVDRIRGVEVEAPPLHRLFGLVRLRVDAAAGAVRGADDEVVVDGVRPLEADRLRTRLLARRPVPADGDREADGPTTTPPGEQETELARFDSRWLLYAPLVGGYLALPLAAVGALFRLVDDLPDRFKPDLGRPDLGDVQVLLAVAVVGLVLLAVGAVIGSALVNWRFRLVRRGGSLIAVRGLLTRLHTELEIDRIRGCTVGDELGMRWVRAARVSALVTGLGDATRRGQLLPLGPRSLAWELAHRLVEDPGPLVRHPPAARRRRLVRATAPGAAVLVVGMVLAARYGTWWGVLVGALLVAGGAAAGLGRYASLGHVAGPRSMSMRSGWLVREQVLLERRALVGWQVRQTLFQRRAGLATVVACVGAGSGGYAATDMAADEVAAFTLAASGRWAGALTR